MAGIEREIDIKVHAPFDSTLGKVELLEVNIRYASCTEQTCGPGKTRGLRERPGLGQGDQIGSFSVT